MARDVFVSYSVPDRDCAFELVTRLEARGLSVWIAPRDISPTAEWAEEIIDAISSARLMVLVFSSHSNSSPQVRREVERAVHKQLPVLPFRLEDIVPSKSLEYFLSSQHWLDGCPPPREPHYERLCA
ncbi:MAG: toll/interleukin-1 receptor domain-containing protein, partial [Steroidobacteraceae bacterium]